MNRAKPQNSVPAQEDENFGKKIGLMATLFGCRHKNLSRPFTRRGISYRVCLGCGARKNFDTKTLITSRDFYYPPKPPEA